MDDPNQQLEVAQKHIEQVLKQVDLRILELEKASESQWTEFRSTLMALKTSLQETQGHIQNEIDVAIGKLKGDLNQVGDLQQSQEILRLLKTWQQDKDDLHDTINNYIGLSETTERSYLFMFRVVGYGLLLLGLFETVNLFIPLKFLNPNWEIQIIAALVQRAAVLLLGVMLVFYKGINYRQPLEKKLLKILSYTCLLVGVGFLLLVPLLIRDTLRIDTYDIAQVNYQLTEKISQLQQVEEQVKQANSLKDVSVIFNRLKGQAPPPQIQDSQQLKKQLFTDIIQVKTKLKQQAEETRANQHFTLVKNSIQWTLSAMVASFLFIWIWRNTRWARFR